MADSAIFLPFFGVMLLTLAVWLFMYYRRTTYLVGERIDLRTVDTPEKVAAVVPEKLQLPSHNLKNLFELPVLFYAVCLYLYVSGNVDDLHVYSAWIFLAFRVVHSVIHCSNNKVHNRFIVYQISAIALWLMVIRAALSAISME